VPEERTTPMQTPQRSRREPAKEDGQETIQAGQPGETPPTIRVGDEPSERGFVRAVTADTPTPQPFPSPAMPYGPPRGPTPAVSADQTMLISERQASVVFAWLVVVESPDRRAVGKVHSLQPDTTTMGRVPGNDIVINDETCSAQHARIRVEAREKQEPAYVLYDMGSRNGVFIGNRESYKDPGSQKYRHELQDGDYILIGDTTLAFKKL
jgi:hypothetical protein